MQFLENTLSFTIIGKCYALVQWSNISTFPDVSEYFSLEIKNLKYRTHWIIQSLETDMSTSTFRIIPRKFYFWIFFNVWSDF